MPELMEVMTEIIPSQVTLLKGWERLELSEFVEKSSRKFYPNKSPEQSVCVELEHVSQVTGQLIGTTLTTPQSSTKNAFAEGEVIFGKLRPYLRKYLRPKFDGVCSSEFWVLRGKPKKCLNEFLFYLVQSEPFVQACAKTTGSKMPRADWDLVQEQPFLLPPKAEQQRIATILSACDRALENIALLLRKQEKRKLAVMQEFLSEEGANRKGWAQIRLKDILTEAKLGGNYENTGVDNGLPVIKMGNIGRGKIHTGKVDYLSLRAKADPADYLQAGDLLFNTRNTLDLVGKVAVWRNELPQAVYNSNLMRMKFDPEKVSSTYFMNYVFNSQFGIKQLRRIATGTTSVAAIYSRDLLKVKINLPPKEIQRKITAVLSLFDKELAFLREQHELLQLQKKGLMQRLLTGQSFTH